MEKKQELKKKIAESIEIPDEVLGVKLSESDKEQLSWGGWSELKHNIHTPDGSVKDGKFKIVKNAKSEIEFNFMFKKEALIIPDKIGNKKLTKEQIEELTHGKTVLINYESKELFLKVDTELNSVTISSGREIGIPDELGDYTLSEKDKENLANNKPLGTKLFKGKEGYFLANVRISHDRKEIIFVDIKTIDRASDIEFYKKKFNKVKMKSQIENILSVVEPDKEKGNEFSKEDEIKAAINASPIDNTLNVAGPVLNNATVKVGLDKNSIEFQEAWTKRDFTKIRELKEKGFKLETGIVQAISKDTKVLSSERTALFTIMGITGNEAATTNGREEKKEARVKIGTISEEQVKGKEAQIKQDMAKKPSEAVKKAERLITQAFDGI